MGALLAESFLALSRELPAQHALMCEQLQGRRVEVCVGAERFFLGFAPGSARVESAGPPAEVLLLTGRRVLADVLDARLSLTRAVLTDALEVVGPLPSLMALHDGLVTYVHGAVRCPSFPPLLARLRAVCREDAAPHSPPGGEAHGSRER
ncbi:sterol-binding-like protein [Pyxidicoccus trucidator]|uniref:sterol-binding-like protein n=1 Tax=Pyxidicoccus trucidator TaxID=2709662 RepID=UPI001967F742|nr:sterol-binding-like protein [Pyxidicoccus trucidator]